MGAGRCPNLAYEQRRLLKAQETGGDRALRDRACSGVQSARPRDTVASQGSWARHHSCWDAGLLRWRLAQATAGQAQLSLPGGGELYKQEAAAFAQTLMCFDKCESSSPRSLFLPNSLSVGLTPQPWYRKTDWKV